MHMYVIDVSPLQIVDVNGNWRQDTLDQGMALENNQSEQVLLLLLVLCMLKVVESNNMQASRE